MGIPATLTDTSMSRRGTVLKILAVVLGVLLVTPLLVIIGSWIAVRKELAAAESDIATHQQPLPERALQAVIAIEDPDFLSRPPGRNREHHGSSLTQRLVKWHVEGRGPKRQFHWLVAALLADLRGDRREIAVAYANTVYMGRVDGRALEGIRAGSLAYFGRPAEQLTPAQLTALVACIPPPRASRLP